MLGLITLGIHGDGLGVSVNSHPNIIVAGAGAIIYGIFYVIGHKQF